MAPRSPWSRKPFRSGQLPACGRCSCCDGQFLAPVLQAHEGKREQSVRVSGTVLDPWVAPEALPAAAYTHVLSPSAPSSWNRKGTNAFVLLSAPSSVLLPNKNLRLKFQNCSRQRKNGIRVCFFKLQIPSFQDSDTPLIPLGGALAVPCSRGRPPGALFLPQCSAGARRLNNSASCLDCSL